MWFISRCRKKEAKIMGRTPCNKSIRNEDQVAADTLYDFIGKKEIVIRAQAAPPLPLPISSHRSTSVPNIPSIRVWDDGVDPTEEMLFKAIIDLSTQCTNIMPLP